MQSKDLGNPFDINLFLQNLNSFRLLPYCSLIQKTGYKNCNNRMKILTF